MTSARRGQQQQKWKDFLGHWLGNTYRASIVTFIGDVCGIVNDLLVHNLLIHFITLQDHYSDTLVIGDDVEESHSAPLPVITVCEESTMPATVCAEVSSTGEGSETVSLQSHSSQASIPEEEISIWVDEMEEQNSKRQKLNDWQTKRQILSLFADDFSRAELQEMIPGLSKWRIDQARQHATEAGKGQPLLEIPSFRTRIEHEKVDHFVEYISRPEFVQDVAFGTKTLKLDSGEKITIPAVIRTVIPSRIIRQYLDYCKEQDFEPASERSLHRMIEVCSASMQKSLHGLDNTTADGTEAFDQVFSMLEGLADQGISVTGTQKSLKDGKRYLKNDFKTHIGRSEH